MNLKLSLKKKIKCPLISNHTELCKCLMQIKIQYLSRMNVTKVVLQFFFNV